jgi:hypothetical protein
MGNNFNWEKTLKEINKFSSPKEKIKFLLEKKAVYEQLDGINIELFGKTFPEKCDSEIKKLREIEKLEKDYPVKNKSEKKFTLPQIALIYYYKEESITRKNSDQIAEKFGHNSGEKLFQLFSKYSSRINRLGDEGTDKKNSNKLKLFEKIISELPEKNKQKAIDEMKTFSASNKTEK